MTETSQRGIFFSLGFQRALSVVIRPPAPEQNTMAVVVRAKCVTSWWVEMIQEGGILPGACFLKLPQTPSLESRVEEVRALMS